MKANEVSMDTVSSKQPKSASVANSVPKICLYNVTFDKDVWFKGRTIPSNQHVVFFTNGDIEYIDETGHIAKRENVGEEITISDVELIGQKFLP